MTYPRLADILVTKANLRDRANHYPVDTGRSCERYLVQVICRSVGQQSADIPGNLRYCYRGFAVGATFGMADQMPAGMDTAHQAVSPSHIMIFLQDRIDQNTANRLKKVEEVVDIEVAGL